MEINNFRGKDIIVFSLKHWDSEIGSTSKIYAKLFAAHGNRVLFVNRSLDRISLIKNRKNKIISKRIDNNKNKISPIRYEENNIWILEPTLILESINWISNDSLYDFLNKINNSRIASEINSAMNEIKFKNPILFIENDFIRSFYLPELIKDIKYTIYYLRDFLTSQSYFKKAGNRLESKLIHKVNLVFCNSEYLTQYALKYNTNSFFIGQGCDFTRFIDKKYKLPSDLSNINKPIIGYSGGLLSTRLDIELIEYLAKSKPEWSFVLIGKEDIIFAKSKLHSIKNIYFLGSKSLDEVPYYVANFDVCINPQLLNEMTVGNYPLKADEYLSLGKPMVATKTNAMTFFSDHIYLAKDKHDFIQKMELAIQEKDNTDLQKSRKLFARQHTWENCYSKMTTIISRNLTIR